jgi:alkylated DNA repair protein (DNA oxidative demethylase)
MTFDLFADDASVNPEQQELASGAFLLRGFATAASEDLIRDIKIILRQAPLRYLQTPGGLTMSVAMSNCGTVGWHSDRDGYRYQTTDPSTGLAWPAMPQSFSRLANDAALAAGYSNFTPDACLINRYQPGSKLSLHQDQGERDLRAPIVSVSLGLPAIFLFGGLQRSDKAYKIALHSGDVVVWGNASRLAFHGIATLQDGQHPLTGRCRLNLTFRQAN